MGLFNIVSNVLKAGENLLNKIPTAKIGSAIANIPVVSSVVKFVEKNPSVAVIPSVGGALKGVTTSSFLKSIPSKIISLATSSPKAVAISSTTAIVGGSALVSNPSGTLGAIAQAPSSATNFLSNVGTAIGSPTKENIFNIAKENPLITTGVIATGIIGATKGVGGLLLAENILNDDEKTIAVQPASSLNAQPLVIDTGNSQVPKSSSSGGLDTPLSPPERETTTISSTRKRYKRAKAKEPQRISQRVNILINNKPSAVGIANKRYIKERLYV